MTEGKESTQTDSPHDQSNQQRPWWAVEVWLKIARLTLREPILRFAGHIVLLGVIALGVWAARMGLDTLPAAAARVIQNGAEALEPTPTMVPEMEMDLLPPFAGGPIQPDVLTRVVDMHTVFPDRPRLEIVKYAVQQGDTLFGIADKFGIKPETLLWGNFDILQDDPHRLRPGQELNVPPVDGTLYTWHEGDGLNGVASFFGVAAQDILDWPGNDLDPNLDAGNPPIEGGTVLVIPGGRRELVTWSAPRISRSNPGVAKILGPGACGAVYDGPVGTGVFVWPAPTRYLSGYDYSSIHPAIDIAGSTGHAIFASDSGVVVYSGWNDWGYGLVVVLDHGNGWQTLYAHLSQINVVCGQAVFQGNVIGGMGCTGNCSGSHLHFEMMHDQYGKVNPWNFLQ
jgi:murein DD-endopeptidase MepM/ murein hydrolase activator NlpD